MVAVLLLLLLVAVVPAFCAELSAEELLVGLASRVLHYQLVVVQRLLRRRHQQCTPAEKTVDKQHDLQLTEVLTIEAGTQYNAVGGAGVSEVIVVKRSEATREEGTREAIGADNGSRASRSKVQQASQLPET